ncbi:MAG: HAMP domain-containing histidine kinase [Candidatus Aureabacteria bacterium]|nr:HAMP domain-containing histidine kinase [Candidatus Auribacterota bacterium]
MPEINREKIEKTQLIQYARDFHRTYEQLLAKNKELQILEKKKNDFLEMVLHELRTPITKVMMSAELIISSQPRDKSRRQLYESLKKGIKKLEYVISEIALAAQQSQDKATIREEPVSLGSLIKKLKKDVEQFVHTRNQKIILSVSAKDIVVKGNTMRLYDAFFNIVQNASKFSMDGTEIKINVKREGESAVVEVIDHGIGIEKNKMGLIFGSFYEDIDIFEHHSGNFEFKSSSLGLGLYISKKIIEKHGGNISVKSKVGKGSAFTVRLPAAV